MESHSTFAPCNSLEASHPWQQRPGSAVTRYYQSMLQGVLKKTSGHGHGLGTIVSVWISLWKWFHLGKSGFCVQPFSLQNNTDSRWLGLDLYWIFEGRKTWAIWSKLRWRFICVTFPVSHVLAPSVACWEAAGNHFEDPAIWDAK